MNEISRSHNCSESRKRTLKIGFVSPLITTVLSVISTRRFKIVHCFMSSPLPSTLFSPPRQLSVTFWARFLPFQAFLCKRLPGACVRNARPGSDNSGRDRQHQNRTPSCPGNGSVVDARALGSVPCKKITGNRANPEQKAHPELPPPPPKTKPYSFEQKIVFIC